MTNYNNIWQQARLNKRTLQAGVLCSWSPIYLWNGKEFARVFNFQKQQSGYTLIEDAWEVELNWANGGVSPFGLLYKQIDDKFYSVGYNTLLGTKNFFNPNTLHVARLTDAALNWLNRCNYHIADILAQNPYVLYQPSRWQWAYVQGKQGINALRDGGIIIPEGGNDKFGDITAPKTQDPITPGQSTSFATEAQNLYTGTDANTANTIQTEADPIIVPSPEEKKNKQTLIVGLAASALLSALS